MDPLKKFEELKPAKKAFSLVQEFKNFAFKGNVVDLAVGLVIGTAFGAIIKSLVDNIIMPLVSLLVPSNESYKSWSFAIGEKKVPYGIFLGDVVSFLVVALALFFVVGKFLNWLMQLRKEETAAVPPMTKDQELLTQIRDLLQQRTAPPA